MDSKAHERIWLQWYSFDSEGLVSWSDSRVFHDDVEYVRADLVSETLQWRDENIRKCKELEVDNEILLDALLSYHRALDEAWDAGTLPCSVIPAELVIKANNAIGERGGG